MKKIYVSLAFIALLVAGCTGNSSGKNSATEEEISTYDSLSNQLEKVKSEIDTLTDKVDELINDL